MRLVKIGDCYINVENVTHAEFETTEHGTTCTVYFNCQVSDGDSRGGVQATLVVSGTAARELKAWLDLRLLSCMEKEAR
ncbi:MAG TPA: hypothetical protein VGR14_21935 [Verrucomicrobiae bacterium]|jgi:hypothetical protein|nr:hypothetical protein [Verrucomicrobiae bacterium]